MAKKWYAVHVYSGFEEKVKAHLEQQIKTHNLEDKIDQILIPMENVVDFKRGKREITQKSFFPGYVLIHMEMDDNLWFMVKNTPKVTGFISSGSKPAPLSDQDVENILKQMQAGIEKPKPRIRFQKGERVRITEGAFANFNGVVEEVNQEKSRLKVMVSIFGRATAVDVDFSQVESA
ncbi:transcription termination/antitermination protein NusG [bacterium]|nr:transcription termination/antitermination protein NusG [candidate division CSSED10-310 bacterium]